MAIDAPEMTAGTGLRGKLHEMLQRVNPTDLTSAQLHSSDFRHSRAEYISVRIRILAFIFAILAPMWIPIDFIFVPDQYFGEILGLRLGFTFFLALLVAWGSQCNRLNAARMRIAMFILVPMLFYVLSRAILGGGLPEEGVMVGYSFLPFLMVALLAVVPLTLLEGVLYIGLVLVFLIGAEFYFGTLFSIRTLGDLWLILLLAAIAIWVQLTQLHMLMRLYREATRDVLTGLVNRRILFGWLTQEVDAPNADQENPDIEPLSVLLFDLDLFKRVNDSYGHLTGDLVLKAFAQVLVRELPVRALVGRYGGEEFLAILPNTEVGEARELAEAVRNACHGTRVHSPDTQAVVSFTTSIGVAQLRSGESAESLLSRVDQGLYQAKESGRDLVAVAQ